MVKSRVLAFFLTLAIIVPMLFLPNSIGLYIRDPKGGPGTDNSGEPVLFFFEPRTVSIAMLVVIEGFYYFFVLTNLFPSLFLIIWSSIANRRRKRSGGLHSEEAVEIPLIPDQGMRRRFFQRGGTENGPLPMGLARSGEFPMMPRTGDELREPHPDVSLIIPCYNEEQSVATAIERAYLQDYEGKIEIIVVNDGSRDNTSAIMSIMADRGGNREVLTLDKPNGGKASALNYGIMHSTGKIIVTTDGDSHLDRSCISNIVGEFKRRPNVGAVGGFVLIRNTHKGYLVKLQQIEYILTQHVIRIPQSEMGNVLIEPGPVFGIRAEIARRYPCLTRTCVEDVDLTQTVLGSGYTTRTALDALSLTEAPTTWRGWFNQRKRWIYGQYQSWRENKQFLKKNPWGLYMYFTWVSTFVTLCILLTLFLITLILLPNLYLNQYLFVFISARTLLIMVIYLLARALILSQYREGKSVILYLPFKIAYDMINSFLAAILYFRFITGMGVRIRWGGRNTKMQ